MKAYWLDIVVVLIFLVIILILLRKGKTKIVRKIIYDLVVQAEKEFGSKTGEVKYAHVIFQIYLKLPFILRLVFTEQGINKFIDDSVKILKLKLNNGEFDLLLYSDNKSALNKFSTMNNEMPIS